MQDVVDYWIISKFKVSLPWLLTMVFLVLLVLKNYEKGLDATMSSLSYQTLFFSSEDFLHFALWVILKSMQWCQSVNWRNLSHYLRFYFTYLRTFESSHVAKLLSQNCNVPKKYAQQNALILTVSLFQLTFNLKVNDP